MLAEEAEDSVVVEFSRMGLGFEEDAVAVVALCRFGEPRIVADGSSLPGLEVVAKGR